MIIHLSNDLMLIAKVSAWAKSNGVRYKNVNAVGQWTDNVNEVISELDSQQNPTLQNVVVDLQMRDLHVAEFAEQVRSKLPQAKLCGYAQHVMTDLISTAETSRYDVVMTRGQFDRQFQTLFETN